MAGQHPFRPGRNEHSKRSDGLVWFVCERRRLGSLFPGQDVASREAIADEDGVNGRNIDRDTSLGVPRQSNDLWPTRQVQSFTLVHFDNFSQISGAHSAFAEAIARDLLEKDGLAGLTMQAVAHRVGVRAPSLYKRVQSRDRLIQLVAEATLTELRAHRQQLSRVQSGAACRVPPGDDAWGRRPGCRH